MLEALYTTPLQHTLIGILATLLVYRAALTLYTRGGRQPWIHPLITAPLVIATALILADISYQSYFSSTALLTAALSPATVALALPLYHQAANIRDNSTAIIVTTTLGATVAVALAIFLAAWVGADDALLKSMATKSITTPIAISLSELIGGIPQLAAGAVIITGVVGAALGPVLLRAVGITDYRIIGFTLGLTAHGIGTARAFDIDREAGAWASLGMGLTGLLTAALLPLLF
jgi:predicted murein hydrolase (TIGR00659 family)